MDDCSGSWIHGKRIKEIADELHEIKCVACKKTLKFPVMVCETGHLVCLEEGRNFAFCPAIREDGGLCRCILIFPGFKWFQTTIKIAQLQSSLFGVDPDEKILSSEVAPSFNISIGKKAPISKQDFAVTALALKKDVGAATESKKDIRAAEETVEEDVGGAEETLKNDVRTAPPSKNNVGATAQLKEDIDTSGLTLKKDVEPAEPALKKGIGTAGLLLKNDIKPFKPSTSREKIAVSKEFLDSDAGKAYLTAKRGEEKFDLNQEWVVPKTSENIPCQPKYDNSTFHERSAGKFPRLQSSLFGLESVEKVLCSDVIRDKVSSMKIDAGPTTSSKKPVTFDEVKEFLESDAGKKYLATERRVEKFNSVRNQEEDDPQTSENISFQPTAGNSKFRETSVETVKTSNSNDELATIPTILMSTQDFARLVDPYRLVPENSGGLWTKNRNRK